MFPCNINHVGDPLIPVGTSTPAVSTSSVTTEPGTIGTYDC